MKIRSSRWRHPYDRGRHRDITVAFQFLLECSTWKRHPEPFSKTRAGRMRRAERRFVDDMKRFASV